LGVNTARTTITAATTPTTHSRLSMFRDCGSPHRLKRVPRRLIANIRHRK
jgi:hypothetical protein